MSAFIRQHPITGKWCVVVVHAGGARQQKTIGAGAAGKELAEQEVRLIAQKQKLDRARNGVREQADLDVVLERWLHGERGSSGKANVVSAATMSRYAVVIRHAQRVLGELGVHRFYALAEEHLEAYRDVRITELVTARVSRGELAAVADAGARKTVYGELTLLGQICKWAAHRGYHSRNVCADVKRPRKPKSLPSAFTDEQKARVLAAAYAQPRDYLMVCLGLYAGLRRSGVCRLETANVCLAESWLRVCEKGEKERVLEIVPALRQAFERCPALPGQYWFGPLDANEVGAVSTHLCALIRAATGIKERSKARFHNLRHTFGTDLVRAGVGAFEAQQALGHGSVKTTEQYVAVAAEQVRAAMRKLPQSWQPPQAAPAAPVAPLLPDHADKH
jgi:site-specific recombinase XerD